MPVSPSPVPGHLGRQFTYAEARAAGLSARRLRAADLESMYRGMRVIPREKTPLGRDKTTPEMWAEEHLNRIRAFATVMRPSQFFAGASAALIHGLPVTMSTPSTVIAVGTHAPHRASRRPGILAKQFAPSLAHTTVRDGLRVLNPSSLWASYGTELSLHDCVALGDAIVRTPRVGGRRPKPGVASLATKTELAAAASVPHRSGRAQLLLALDLVQDGVASPPETHLRLFLVEHGFPPLQLDFDVHAPSGAYLGTSEIVFLEYRLALEYEGDHHRTDRKQWNRDIEKYRRYREAGWEVVRVTAEMLYRRPRELAAAIHHALIRQGMRP